jgi:hypothetical protein
MRIQIAVMIPPKEKSKTGVNIAAPNRCSFCIILSSSLSSSPVRAKEDDRIIFSTQLSSFPYV